MDWSGALGTRFFRGAAMYLGFRTDGPWDTGAVCSSTAVGGGRILPVREKPDVCGLLRRLDGLVGCVRQSEPRYACGGAYCHGGRCFVCEILGGADAPQNVWRGL